MKRSVKRCILLGCLAMAGPQAAAQQHANDEGVADSAYLLLEESYAGGVQRLLAHVYFYNSPQTLQSALLVFRWDHPGLVFESVSGTPLAESAFELCTGLDESQVTDPMVQAFVALSILPPNLAPDSVTRRMGTVHFTFASWDVGDLVCFDSTTIDIATTTFYPPSGPSYVPIWPGEVCLELGDTILTDIEGGLSDETLPDEYYLAQNYPNPFNPVTSIEYSLPISTRVELVVVNTLGQTVNTLVNDVRSAGRHSAVWDGTDRDGEAVASGLYLYRLTAGDQTQTRKMLLLK